MLFEEKGNDYAEHFRIAEVKFSRCLMTGDGTVAGQYRWISG